jgi:VIT1/CCC1 family predicted Fe2+/Mn2+ transporter
MVDGGNGARIASIAIGVVTAALAGGTIARQSERPVVFGAIRQVAILLLAVGVTYAIGSVVGINVS